MTMPMSAASPGKNSLSRSSSTNLTAAGQRFSIFSFSWRKLAGGRTIRFTSRCGFSRASLREKAGRTLSLVWKRPCTWHARMRTSSMTGVFEASLSSKPFSTMRTMVGRLGRGSRSQTWLFIAKAWLRSCMIEEPSP